MELNSCYLLHPCSEFSFSKCVFCFLKKYIVLNKITVDLIGILLDDYRLFTPVRGGKLSTLEN